MRRGGLDPPTSRLSAGCSSPELTARTFPRELDMQTRARHVGRCQLCNGNRVAPATVADDIIHLAPSVGLAASLPGPDGGPRAGTPVSRPTIGQSWPGDRAAAERSNPDVKKTDSSAGKNSRPARAGRSGTVRQAHDEREPFAGGTPAGVHIMLILSHGVLRPTHSVGRRDYANPIDERKRKIENFFGRSRDRHLIVTAEIQVPPRVACRAIVRAACGHRYGRARAPCPHPPDREGPAPEPRFGQCRRPGG